MKEIPENKKDVMVTNREKVVDILMNVLSKLSENINHAENAGELKELSSAVCSIVVTLFSI